MKALKRFVLAVVLALAASVPASAQDIRPVGVPFACGADNIGATLTELTNCAALSQTQAALRYYITAIVTQSTTTTGGTFALRSGTGTNCGTGTANVLPASVGTARYSSPASTSPAGVIAFNPPVLVTPGHALCVLGVATNTTTISVFGFIAP